MELTARPRITAGLAAVAVVSAGAIVTSVAAPMPAVSGVQSRPVQLVASDDIPWDQVLQTAFANATDIYDHLSPATFADVQQFAANVPDYLDGTRNFNADLSTAYNAATNPFTPVDPEPYVYSSLDPTPSNISIDSLLLGHITDIDLAGKAGLLDILANGLDVDGVSIPVLPAILGDSLAAEVSPYLDFSGSPLSGILWGSIGTTLSPFLQFHDDVTGIMTALDGANPDYTSAIQDLLNMPANLTNAFLNGYGDVNLDTVLTDLGIATPPTDADLTADLGGLLSPAGSLIDGLGFSDTVGECSVLCATLDVPSTAVGPIASLFEQDQAVAESIGWDGVGQPLAHLFSELTTLF